MPAFVIRFHEPAKPSGEQTDKEDCYSISYDHFYEHYCITATFSNSNLKPISMNTLDEVKRFLHSLYKYVNLDMCVDSGNYIAYTQIDGGMFPTITVPRRKLLDAAVIANIDEALDVWAKVTVPGIQLRKSLAERVVQTPTTPTCNPYACCQPGGYNYEQHFGRLHL